MPLRYVEMKKTGDIALRALVQGNLSLRSQYENHAPRSLEKATPAINAHSQWLDEHGILAAMEQQEQEWILMPPGTWNPGLITENLWKIESFKALLWALSFYDEMPSYFELIQVSEIYKLAQYPENPEGFTARAALRDANSLENERRVYKFLNWRCRTELLMEQGEDPPPGDSYESTIARAMTSVPTGSTFITHDESDIILNGSYFSEYEDRRTVMSLCFERHLALEWVCGSEKWSQTHTDT